MTFLEITNVAIFQWFCVRLTRCQQKTITGFQSNEGSYLPTGKVALSGKIISQEIRSWYTIQGFITPLTGWRKKPFKRFGKQFTFKVSRVTTIK